MHALCAAGTFALRTSAVAAILRPFGSLTTGLRVDVYSWNAMDWYSTSSVSCTTSFRAASGSCTPAARGGRVQTR